MEPASAVNLFTSDEMANDPVRSAKLTAASIASLAAARIESGDLSADLMSQLLEISRQLTESESQNRLTEAELAARAKAIEREAQNLARLRQDFERSRDEWQAVHEQFLKNQRKWTHQVQKQDQLLQQKLDKLDACSLQLKALPEISGDDSNGAIAAPVMESRISHQREIHLDMLLRDAEERENQLLTENQKLEERIDRLSKELDESLGRGFVRLVRDDYITMADELEASHRDADRLRRQISRQDAEMELIREELKALQNADPSSEKVDTQAIATDEASLQEEISRQVKAQKETWQNELLQQAEAERERLQQEFQEQETAQREALEASQQRCQEFEAECAALVLQLEETADEASGTTGEAMAALATDEEVAELKEKIDLLERHHKMAMEDIKEFKAENRSLQQELQNAQAQASAETPASGDRSYVLGELDWEEEKHRLMEMLEADFPEDEQATPAQKESARNERLTIENVIDQTDRIVAIKKRDVEELRKLLENQSAQVGNLAVGVGAFAEAFDHDELIAEERENLKRRQDQIHEKLKKAEVELSMERAKVARERIEIEEMLDKLGYTKETMKEAVEELEKEKASKGESRRKINPKANKQVQWFDRLGIKNDDE